MLRLLASQLLDARLDPSQSFCHVSLRTGLIESVELHADSIRGPFELVKNVTQNSEMRNATSMDDPVRNSYSKKGSIKTAMNVVRHRGYLGLWSGFRLHLRKLT